MSCNLHVASPTQIYRLWVLVSFRNVLFCHRLLPDQVVFSLGGDALFFVLRPVRVFYVYQTTIMV